MLNDDEFLRSREYGGYAGNANQQRNEKSEHRIMVIDDDPHLVAVLSEGLHLLGGFDVYSASDGVMGLHGIVAMRPDCVIMDIRMPGLNGYQLLRLLRGDPTTAHLGVVVLSVLAHDYQALAGMVSGADAYLFKPVHMADVYRAMREVMALTPAERSLRRRQLLDPGPPPGTYSQVLPDLTRDR